MRGSTFVGRWGRGEGKKRGKKEEEEKVDVRKKEKA